MTEAEQNTTPRPRGARLKRALLSLVLFTVSLVVSLAMLEVAARILLGDGPLRIQIYEPHPTLMYIHKPGFEANLLIERYKPVVTEPTPVSISSLGLRDQEYGPKREGEYRIFMLGDSYTFGWALPESESIPRQLESRLRARYPERDITVINGGSTGYAPWQSRELFHLLYEELEPDMVVMQTFQTNDVAHSLSQAGEPVETLRAYRGWRARYVRRLALSDYAVARFDQWMLGHSWAYYYICEALGSDLAFTKIWNAVGVFGEVPVPPLPPNAPRNPVYETELCKSYPALGRAWARFEADLAQLRDDCHTRGIRFAAYNVPYPFDLAVVEGETAGVPEGTYCIDQANRRVEDFFAETGMAYVPMLDVFRNYPEPETVYFPFNRHVNERGIAIIVEELMRGVFADGLPPPVSPETPAS